MRPPSPPTPAAHFTSRLRKSLLAQTGTETPSAKTTHPRRRLDADLDHFKPIGKDIAQGLVNIAEVTHILERRSLRKETVSTCVKRRLKAQAVASEAIK